MGDPHNNKWGSHNNSFGNKKSNNKPKYNGSISKLGGLIIGGVVLYAATQAGLGQLLEIKDSISKVQTVTEDIKDLTSQSSTSSTGTKLEYLIEKKLMSQLEIDEDTVADLIDYLVNSTKTIDTTQKFVFLNYETLDSNSSYQEKVVTTLSNYSEPVTFVFISNKDFTDTQFEKEKERIVEIVNNNTATNADFTRVTTYTILNKPSIGKATITISFS